MESWRGGQRHALVNQPRQNKRHPGAPDQVQGGGGDEVVRAAGFECCDAADEDGGHEEEGDAHGSGDGDVEGNLGDE